MALSGADVTFLVRERRARQLADGLKIESPLGDATVKVKTLSEGEPADPFHIIVLTCKAYGLAGALDSIAPYVSEGTVILPLLNGVAHMATIDARFPEAEVWGGVAHIPAALRSDGSIHHYGTVQSLTVGPRPAGAATGAIAEGFVAIATHAGIDARVSDHIEQDLWDKWVFLATLAAATCLMRADVGSILKTSNGEFLLLALLDECASVTAAEGHPSDAKHMKMYQGILTDRSSNFRASMLTDMEAGNPTEADHILGDMIHRAEEHGIETPLLRVAYSRLQAYEADRGAG